MTSPLLRAATGPGPSGRPAWSANETAVASISKDSSSTEVDRGTSRPRTAGQRSESLKSTSSIAKTVDSGV